MKADTVMLQKILCAGLLACCVIGCTIEPRKNDAEESVVLTPTVPLVPQSDPVVPIVDEKVPDRFFDIFGPKLVESTVESGRIDPNTDVISLRFNEDITEIDIKLVDSSDQSMKWILSIDMITGRRVFLARVNGRKLGSDRTYYIKGFVEDKEKNKTTIDIEFRAVEENRDRSAPSILTSSIGHGARNVSINTDQIVFTFNEKIAGAEASLVRGDWQTGPDMRWTRFIDENKVVLVKISGKSLSLRNNQVYSIVLKASDASGNWTPGGNLVWVYEFTTQR